MNLEFYDTSLDTLLEISDYLTIYDIINLFSISNEINKIYPDFFRYRFNKDFVSGKYYNNFKYHYTKWIKYHDLHDVLLINVEEKFKNNLCNIHFCIPEDYYDHIFYHLETGNELNIKLISKVGKYLIEKEDDITFFKFTKLLDPIYNYIFFYNICYIVYIDNTKIKNSNLINIINDVIYKFIPIKNDHLNYDIKIFVHNLYKRYDSCINIVSTFLSNIHNNNNDICIKIIDYLDNIYNYIKNTNFSIELTRLILPTLDQSIIYKSLPNIIDDKFILLFNKLTYPRKISYMTGTNFIKYMDFYNNNPNVLEYEFNYNKGQLIKNISKHVPENYDPIFRYSKSDYNKLKEYIIQIIKTYNITIKTNLLKWSAENGKLFILTELINDDTYIITNKNMSFIKLAIHNKQNNIIDYLRTNDRYNKYIIEINGQLFYNPPSYKR